MNTRCIKKKRKEKHKQPKTFITQLFQGLIKITPSEQNGKRQRVWNNSTNVTCVIATDAFLSFLFTLEIKEWFHLNSNFILMFCAFH